MLHARFSPIEVSVPSGAGQSVPDYRYYFIMRLDANPADATCLPSRTAPKTL